MVVVVFVFSNTWYFFLINIDFILIWKMTMNKIMGRWEELYFYFWLKKNWLIRFNDTLSIFHISFYPQVQFSRWKVMHKIVTKQSERGPNQTPKNIWSVGFLWLVKLQQTNIFLGQTMQLSIKLICFRFKCEPATFFIISCIKYCGSFWIDSACCLFWDNVLVEASMCLMILSMLTSHLSINKCVLV